MNRRTLVAGALVLSGLITGCGATTVDSAVDTTALRAGPQTATLSDDDVEPISTAPQSVLPATVDSFDGQSVTVTDTSRIIAADRYGTLGQTVFALGLGPQMVGRDESTIFPSALAVPSVTAGGHQINAEAILDLDPSVLLVDSSIGPAESIDQIRRAGVPVVFFDPQRAVDTAPDQIRAVAAALGVTDVGDRLAERTLSEIDAAKAAVPEEDSAATVAFLYIRGPALQLLAGPGSGADGLIEALGLTDAGTKSGQSEQFLPITSEALVATDPDVILVMSNGAESVGGTDGILQIPGVGQTSAGENQRIVEMDDSELLSFGPRVGLVLAALVNAVYV